MRAALLISLFLAGCGVEPLVAVPTSDAGALSAAPVASVARTIGWPTLEFADAGITWPIPDWPLARPLDYGIEPAAL